MPTATLMALGGTVLISVNRKDKPEVVEIARLFKEAGFKILATGSTHKLITESGIEAEKVNNGSTPMFMVACTKAPVQQTERLRLQAAMA